MKKKLNIDRDFTTSFATNSSSFLAAVGLRRSFRESNHQRSSSERYQSPQASSRAYFQSISISSDEAKKERGLLELCQDNEVDLVRKLVSKPTVAVKIRTSLNSPLDSYGNTCLHVSVSYNDFTLAAVMLIKGANPNQENRSKVSPTTLAVRLFGLESTIVELLILHGGIVWASEREKGVNGLYKSNSKMATELQNTTRQSSETKYSFKKQPIILSLRNESFHLNNPHQRKLDFSSSETINSNPSENLSSDLILKITKIIPKSSLTCHSAAFLNLKFNGELNAKQFCSFKTKSGATPLMKAAYNGNLDFIKTYLENGDFTQKDVDISDCRGLTALSYAAFSGHLNVVTYLIQVAHSSIHGAQHSGINPWEEDFIPSPLILAAFSGHSHVVDFLISNGADINARAGGPKGCTAVMVASWMRNLSVLKCLRKHSVTIDPEIEIWVKSGFKKLKRFSVDLPSCGWDLKGWHLVLSEQSTNRHNLRKESMFLLSSDDIEEAGKVVQILKFDESIFKAEISDDIPQNSLRQTKNFDSAALSKGLHYSKIDLTEVLPERGTELDEIFLDVFKYVVQLALAANRNDKPTYVVIAAKAILISSKILDYTENLRNSINSSNPSVVPISPWFSPVLSDKLGDTSIFAKSLLMNVLLQQSHLLKSEFQESLMFSTKIACGIWPPASAVADMIQSAALLSSVCHAITDLANCLGYFPITEKILELKLDRERRLTAEVDSRIHHVDFENEATRIWPRPNLLTFEKYKQLNDLYNVEQLSKEITSSQSAPQDSENAAINYGSDEEYFHGLEQTLKKFVIAVTDLKKLQIQKLKDRYVPAATMICRQTNEVIENIQSFDLFVDFAESFDSVVFDEADVEKIEKTGLKLQVINFPASALSLLDEAQQEVIEASATILEFSKTAGLVWSTPMEERKMLESCYPCVLGVKKLFTISKAVAAKIRECWEVDLRRQQEWNRKTTQNENIQTLFEAWRGADGSNQQYDISKLKLDDAIDGIVCDSKQNLIKGGRISNIVELATSHNNYDSETANILLMCHHSVITSQELLKHLTNRYERIIPPNNLNEREFRAWFEIKVKPIQQNVLNLINTWIDLYFEQDFLQNEILLNSLRNFLEKIVLSDWETNARLLIGTIDLKIANSNNFRQTLNKQTIKQIPKPFGIFSIIDPILLFTDPLKVLEIDPMEFAKQLTLIEFEIFLLVNASECLDQIWASKVEKERAAAKMQALIKTTETASKSSAKEYISSPESSISKMISHTNNLSLWIATMVISCANIKIRVLLVRYFAQCAVKCREIKNYNGITGIVAGLSMAPVARLHRTWRKFNKHHPAISAEYEDSSAIVSPKGQYANYRKELKDVKLPAVPFLGVYLTDITFVELGNPELLPGSDPNLPRHARIINFDKCRKIHTIVKEIQRFQNISFNWAAIESLQAFINRLGEETVKFSDIEEKSAGFAVASEDDLYNQSLIIEPKEEDEGEESDEEQ